MIKFNVREVFNDAFTGQVIHSYTTVNNLNANYCNSTNKNRTTGILQINKRYRPRFCNRYGYEDGVLQSVVKDNILEEKFTKSTITVDGKYMVVPNDTYRVASTSSWVTSGTPTTWVSMSNWR